MANSIVVNFSSVVLGSLVIDRDPSVIVGVFTNVVGSRFAVVISDSLVDNSIGVVIRLLSTVVSSEIVVAISSVVDDTIVVTKVSRKEVVIHGALVGSADNEEVSSSISVVCLGVTVDISIGTVVMSGVVSINSVDVSSAIVVVSCIDVVISTRIAVELSPSAAVVSVVDDVAANSRVVSLNNEVGTSDVLTLVSKELVTISALVIGESVDSDVISIDIVELSEVKVVRFISVEYSSEVSAP